MKILFVMLHPGYIRNYDSTLRLLAQRGHHVHLGFNRSDKLNGRKMLDRLVQECPTISFSDTRPPKGDGWLSLARDVRCSIDYLRYLDPRFKDARKLRARAEERVSRATRALTKSPLLRRRGGIRLLAACFTAMERAIPCNREIKAFIEQQQCDIVLVTPLVEIGSDQVDYLKSAQAAGLRTGLCVHSWDNLTNKGLMRIIPDLVAVWNGMQKTEAVELHGVPPANVVVTGAPSYDQWFNWRPSRPRREFCQHVGLDPDKPFVLYLCSSPFIAPDEPQFVRKWLERVRAVADPQLRDVAVLVRPHPQNVEPWRHVELSDFSDVATWPRGGANPTDEESRADYYDSMYHSAAVMGINTSALIEAGIVGRPVYTLLAPEFADTQEGTLHFHHLLNVNGGLLYAAESFEEHLAQLSKALSDTTGSDQKSRRFIEAFVRPHGVDTPATPILVDAIEQLGKMGLGAPTKVKLRSYPVRLLLYPLALLKGFERGLEKRAKRRRGAQSSGATAPAAFQWTLWPLRRALSACLDLVLRRRRIRAFLVRHVVPRITPTSTVVKGVKQTKKDQKTTSTELKFAATVEATRETIRRVAASNRPLIVGPWLSEVGFELLYWIPFLHWAKAHSGLAKERLVIVSRGGAAPWYRHLSSNYWDILDHLTPEEFLQKNEQRMANGKQKHRTLSDLDRDIIKLVEQTLGIKDANLLHPSLMYQLFSPFWKKQATLRLVESFTSYQPFESIRPTAGLPDEYIAAKFYFNYSFPDTPGNRTFVSAVLKNLCAVTNVVLLSTGLRLDDHSETGIQRMERLYTVENLITPSNNLQVQTSVICGARAFVGTYGGFSYLAPFYGVNSLSFYSARDQFVAHHLEVAQRVFTTLNRGSFTALDVRDLDLVRLLLGNGGPPAILSENGVSISA